MKKSRYTEEQVIDAVKQMEAGRKAKELARELGVSEATLYAWKSKYGGLEVSEARRLRDLEQENARLKKLVAELSLDKDALQTVIRKKRMELVERRRDVALVMAKHRLSERQACKLLELDRTTYRYEPRPDRNAGLRQPMIELARQKPRYGYRRLGALLAAGAPRVAGESEADLPAVPSGAPGRAAAETQTGTAHGAAEGDAHGAEPGMGDRLRDGFTGDGAELPGADDRGPLHARVSGHRGR